jgi:hypothetical protein
LNAVARALGDPRRTDGRRGLDGTGIERARLERGRHRGVRVGADRRRVGDERARGIDELVRVGHRDGRPRVGLDDLEVARDAETARGTEARRDERERREDPGAMAEETACVHQNRPVRPALDGLA